ncbi:hypothetical protein BC834DRAFT_845187 [Gloeopeniophorella convolvens]|nr:hypothetical protein BC834DRAFT_845187 [Gloeopeniophorella convolvens]
MAPSKAGGALPPPDKSVSSRPQRNATKASRSALKRYFVQGGALDSQTTESQILPDEPPEMREEVFYDVGEALLSPMGQIGCLHLLLKAIPDAEEREKRWEEYVKVKEDPVWKEFADAKLTRFYQAEWEACHNQVVELKRQVAELQYRAGERVKMGKRWYEPVTTLQVESPPRPVPRTSSEPLHELRRNKQATLEEENRQKEKDKRRERDRQVKEMSERVARALIPPTEVPAPPEPRRQTNKNLASGGGCAIIRNQAYQTRAYRDWPFDLPTYS